MYTLVTGATSDIGKQICHTLAHEGHALLLTDLSELALIELCESLHGDRHQYVSLDFVDLDQARTNLQQFLVERKIVVSNAVFAAGLFAVRPLKTLSLDFCRKNFDIALFSAILN